MHKKDFVGIKFGKLLVEKHMGHNKNRHGLWKCKCDCGSEVVVNQCSLVSGNTKSCGCYMIEKATKHNMSKIPQYNVWKGIISRCEDENACQYKNYGARGISVCEEWHDLQKFVKWTKENGYKKGLQIDRINNDGNYEPSNCRFVTAAENSAVGRRRKNSKNTSGFVGVSYIKKYKSWEVSIKKSGVTFYVGSYKSIDDAIKARINKEIELFGEQRTNFNL